MEFYLGLEQGMKSMSTGSTFFTVKDRDDRVNTMAMSFGYVGFSWKRPYFIAFVGPTRYSYELVKNAEDFTVSIPFDGKMERAIMVCGTKSGRDVDKAEAAEIKFLPAREVRSPIVDGCDLFYECRITYIDKIHAERLPREILLPLPPMAREHDLVFGEIVAVYRS